jgi:hypothetical protein
VTRIATKIAGIEKNGLRVFAFEQKAAKDRERWRGLSPNVEDFAFWSPQNLRSMQ